ncbi:MAG: hypothetical protein EB120_05480 [Proteobacteria bacterium]|nr:hypothetical protein [Pseudomonadota bacterium]
MNEGQRRMSDRFFDRFGKIPTPTCNVCSKPVNEFGISFNPDNSTMTFSVKCHGEKEDATMWYDKVMSLPDETVPVVQKAFANQPKRRIII